MFTLGYPSKDDAEKHILKEITDITVGYPKKGWAPDIFLHKQYFVIKFK